MLPFLMETMATNMTTTSPGQNKALVLQAFDTLAASHAAPHFASASNLRGFGGQVAPCGLRVRSH